MGLASVRWAYKGEQFDSPVIAKCELCGADAIIALPPTIVAEQKDGTTHVCHPFAGGCNHGFARELTSRPSPARPPRAGYRAAVAWIAENDAPGDDDDVDKLAGYLTVCLVADLFGRDQRDVAVDVKRLREKAAAS